MIKKVRKDKIVMNAENEDISMLAEIETAPLEISPEELENEFPVMTLRNIDLYRTDRSQECGHHRRQAGRHHGRRRLLPRRCHARCH